MAELDHAGVSEVVQIHPHHGFGNVLHPHEEISDSDQDVVLGGAGTPGANVAVDERAVLGRGQQTYEMFVGREVTKNALAECNWSSGEPAVDPSIPAGICDFCSAVIWPSWG
jgi:hypothetical protein